MFTKSELNKWTISMLLLIVVISTGLVMTAVAGLTLVAVNSNQDGQDHRLEPIVSPEVEIMPANPEEQIPAESKMELWDVREKDDGLVDEQTALNPVSPGMLISAGTEDS